MPALLAVKVWGSKTGWPLAVMILSLAYLWEAGVMLMLSTLRSRAGLDHVASAVSACPSSDLSVVVAGTGLAHQLA